MDRFLGAVFQAKYATMETGLQENAPFAGAPVIRGFSLVTNNTVNLVSLSIVAAVGLLFVDI